MFITKRANDGGQIKLICCSLINTTNKTTYFGNFLIKYDFSMTVSQQPSDLTID